MNTRTFTALIVISLFGHQLLAQNTNPIAIYPDEDTNSPATHQVIWSATPGVRYEVEQTSTLTNWSLVPGYPAAATGPAEAMPFTATNDSLFFRVGELDEQPPTIVDQYPLDGGFAVPRFSKITVQLGDVTGIDTNSIQLIVGTNGTFTLTDTQLTYSNGVLTYDGGGDIPLGAYGQTNQSTLVMADTLGNSLTNEFSFRLEVEPEVVANLWVLGSPQSQRAGQRVGNIPTASLAALYGSGGPARAGDGDPWTLELVESNRVVLAYTNTPPGFVTDQYICNLTPANPEQIFNRRITNIVDDPGNKLLTLFTVEVPLEEMVTNGTASVSSETYILEMGTNGAFARAFQIGGDITFPRIGFSLDGAVFRLKEDGYESVIDGETTVVGTGSNIVSITAEQCHVWLTPQLEANLEVNLSGLKQFRAVASGELEIAQIADVDVLLLNLRADDIEIFDLPEAVEPKTWMLVGVIGVPPFAIPVYASLGFDMQLLATAEAQADLNFRWGFTQVVSAEFGISYDQPDLSWIKGFDFPLPALEPFTYSINGEMVLELSLEPKLEFLVYGLAGVSAGITPKGRIIFVAGTGEPLSGRIEADVSLDVGLAGPAFEALFNPLPGVSYSLWDDQWHLFPDEAQITFTLQPDSQTVELGQSAYFSSEATGPGTVAYQWFYNDIPMQGKTSRSLSIPSVSLGDAGTYHVRALVDGDSSNSAPATLTVISPSLQEGLVAWYPFDGNAQDHSGYGNHGDVYGATTAAGKIGSAFYFDGSDHVEIPHTASLDLRSRTYCAWVKFSVTQQGWGGIVSKAHESIGTSDVIGLQMNVVHQALTGQALGVGGNQVDADGTSALNDDVWHFVTLRFDQSGGSIQVFVDAILESEEQTSWLLTDDLANTVPILIGVDRERSFFATGLIDEVRIFNRALSDTEITQLYNTGLSPAPSGMALIQAGWFTMGDVMNDYPSGNEHPVHDVYVSAFYMDRTDVTNDQMVEVLQWAYGQDKISVTAATVRNLDGSQQELLDLDDPDCRITWNGSQFQMKAAKGSGYPCVEVTWYGAVAFCNYRSEMEGLTPCYNLSDWSCNWSANGYRLPTEAEWEKAARGGLTGKRFPWGDEIDHSRANYRANGSAYLFDVSPYTSATYHPDYDDDGFPYTSPVKDFPPNGYGLYDMVGNTWEWVWDRYSSYSSSSEINPRGPTSGSGRINRGGGWSHPAFNSRPACRNYGGPSASEDALSFCCVKAVD